MKMPLAVRSLLVLMYKVKITALAKREKLTIAVIRGFWCASTSMKSLILTPG